MRRSVILFVSVLAVLCVVGMSQPVIAFSSALVSNLTFQYPQYLNGVYIFSGTVVSVGFTITNVGSQYTLFMVCAVQRVGFSGGSYGNHNLLGCLGIGLGAYCATYVSYCAYSSRIGTISGSVSASAPGQLQIQILAYDPSISASIPLAASPWTPVTQIIPQNY
jgi:hypothetical protein